MSGSSMNNEFTRTFQLFKRLAKRVAPPPLHTISSWADAYRKLSAEASAEPGQWRTDRTPYMRDIMNALNDREVEKIVVMSSAQVGKTELLLNIVGYYVDYDPAPMMLIQPTEGMGEAFSKDRLAPMVRDTEVLSKKISDAKARDGENTILHKKFPGGQITIGGANAPASLASRPIRIVLCDEVDRYPVSAGTEGDPVSLVVKRTTTFWNRKIVLVSTPTIKGASRIETDYLQSTMEQWCLPCPSCNELQPLTWGQIKFERVDEIVTKAAHACQFCGSLHGEFEWKKGSGTWVARKKNSKVRGFHLNELASPWKRWETIASEFLEAKRGGPEMLKVWVNTSLGETWEEQGEGVETDELLKRREMYNGEVPDDVLVLTAAVDVQDNRLEYEIVGWGLGLESYGIKYGVIMGDPGQNWVWETLDQTVIHKSFTRIDGQDLQVMSTCIDSGGHFTQQVYKYCKKREFNRVWAIKGQGGMGIPFIQRPKRRNDAGVWLFNIGVDVGKDTIASRLKLGFEGPGYCHFPIETDKGYNEDYFEGLTSEKRTVRYQKGSVTHRWEKRYSGARNEPFDLRNYATAAVEILNPQLEEIKKRMDLNKIEPKLPKKEQQGAKKRSGVVRRGIEV